MNSTVLVPVSLCHPMAKMPVKKHHEDAGWDLYATTVDYMPECRVVYGTGVKMRIPDGYVGKIYPRSSIRDMGLSLANSVGIIDAGYVGEIKLTFRTWGATRVYSTGDRIGQIVIEKLPIVEFHQVNELEQTIRGEQGHGSTGLK